MNDNQQSIAYKARKHSSSIMDFFSVTREGYALRAKNSYQAGYEDCLKDSMVKFDKSFEALYKIAMNMADTCIGQKTIDARFDKLEEEYQELVEAFGAFKKQYEGKDTGQWAINDQVANDLMGEASDLLFVLLHIAHKFKRTPFELLHNASSKMLLRMNDADYKAKI